MFYNLTATTIVCRQIFLFCHCEITVSPEVPTLLPFLKTCVHVEENRLNLLHPAEEIWPGGRQRGSFFPDRERTTGSAARKTPSCLLLTEFASSEPLVVRVCISQTPE